MTKTITKQEALSQHVCDSDIEEIKYNINDLSSNSEDPKIFYYYDKVYLVFTEKQMLDYEKEQYFTYHNEMVEQIILAVTKYNMSIPSMPTTDADFLAKRLGIPCINMEKHDEIKTFLDQSLVSSKVVFDVHRKNKLLKDNSYVNIRGYYIKDITIKS